MIRPLSRRTLLRGAGGVAIALPWLEAMQPRRARAAAPAKRLVVWFTSNGQNMEGWTPTGGETDFTLSPILKPLERHRGSLLVLNNLRMSYGHAHSLAASCQLTGRPPIQRPSGIKFASSGISIDQHIVKTLKLADKTKLPSLHLGVNVGKQDGDSSASICWSDADQPILPQDNPYEVFKQLFGEFAGVGANDIDKLRAAKKSVLDAIRDNAALIAPRLGKDDQQKLNEHLEGIRQIEKNLDVKSGDVMCKTVTPLGEQIVWFDDRNAPAIGKVQMDLLVMALACDMTRVASLQWAKSGGITGSRDRTHPWIPDAVGAWHGVSHDKVNGPPKMIKIGAWYAEQLAYLADKMKAIDEGGSSLLDNSVVFWTSEYGPNEPDPLSHYTARMPYLLLGSCGGAFKTGRNLVYPTPTRKSSTTGAQVPVYDGEPVLKHNQLLVSLMNAMGVPGDTFGQMNDKIQAGPLPRLGG